VNLDKWHSSITAGERRVLLTKWTATAWGKLRLETSYIKRLFEKTGCLLTVDGSEDDKVRPQGLNNYKLK
jgi:hypothetical protein